MHFQTARLTVRDFVPEDLTSLAPFRADPDIAKFMDFDVETFEQSKTWLTEAIGHNAASPRFSHHSAIILNATGEITGWVAVGHPENEANSIADRAIGYAMGKKFWGRGIMPEAVRGMLRFCFDQWRVSSVSAQCSKGNDPSSRCLQKAGMQFVKEFVSPRPEDGLSLLYIARSAEWMPHYGNQAWKSEG